jgi:hypothetical protein
MPEEDKPRHPGINFLPPLNVVLTRLRQDISQT